MDIFDHSDKKRKQARAPLADRMRPRSLEEFMGQAEILGPGTLLRTSIERDEIVSMIFWGPPGSGKTTLARIIAERSRAAFIAFSAVPSGIKEVREVIEKAGNDLKYYGKKTILFIDEIHRFNKAQQDVFLPFVEDGTIVLIGATTENPSFEVNSALLSRTRVYVFGQLTDEDLAAIIRRALTDTGRGLGGLELTVDADALAHLASHS